MLTSIHAATPHENAQARQPSEGRPTLPCARGIGARLAPLRALATRGAHVAIVLVVALLVPAAPRSPPEAVVLAASLHRVALRNHRAHRGHQGIGRQYAHPATRSRTSW